MIHKSGEVIIRHGKLPVSGPVRRTGTGVGSGVGVNVDVGREGSTVSFDVGVAASSTCDGLGVN